MRLEAGRKPGARVELERRQPRQRFVLEVVLLEHEARPQALTLERLDGMIEVAAVHGRANASLIAGYGYAGILIAFLARQNPLAIMPMAVLVGGIGAAGGLVQRRMGLPDATVQVLQGTIFVFILGGETLYGRFAWFQPRGAR